jgi:hypothetical protein
MEFERNTLMLNFLLGGGEWIKETDREYQVFKAGPQFLALKDHAAFKKNVETLGVILYKMESGDKKKSQPQPLFPLKEYLAKHQLMTH